MSAPFEDTTFPRAPLVGVVAVVLVALLAVALVRITGVGAARQPDAATVATRDLRFEDRPDGGIDVYDARDNRLVETVAPASNGFIRGTLRGLSRERKRAGLRPGRAVPPDRPGRRQAHTGRPWPPAGGSISSRSDPPIPARFAKFLGERSDAR